MTRVTVTLDGTDVVLDDGMLHRDRDELGRPTDSGSVRYAAAAAHVVMTTGFATLDPERAAALSGEALLPFVDFDATLAQRRRLASHGFAIAEAMDTAQRFEVGWPVASELIRRTGEARLPHGFVAGAGADSASDPLELDAAIESTRSQIREIRAAGGIPIVLPLLALPKRDANAAEYVATYRKILADVEGPVFLHWLGPMFLPSLAGYFPGDSFERLLALEAERVRGAKISLLDAAFERRIRRTLAARDQIVLTGDDHHFADLIAGDSTAPSGATRIGSRDYPIGEFSHALLGIFDAIAAPAGLALRWLARGRRDRYTQLMAPLERLGQVIFEAPTEHYKAGLAFLSWLNGWQTDFTLPRHANRRRTRDHLLRVAVVAGTCGVIESAPTARDRLEAWSAAH